METNPQHDETESHDEARSGPPEPPAGEREVDPAEGPGPRGNQEVDEERLRRDQEDLGSVAGN